MDFDNVYYCGCNSAKIELVKENKCIVCGNEGLSVSKITVEHL
ncbi:MAG: hypothetical protein SCL54_11565 [Bacillota bacterium]|nr:hypothetical protein [Bacillota bacterium]